LRAACPVGVALAHVRFLKSAKNSAKTEARHEIKIYQKAIEQFDVVIKVLRAETRIKRGSNTVAEVKAATRLTIN
jgi:hypothetical protein